MIRSGPISALFVVSALIATSATANAAPILYSFEANAFGNDPTRSVSGQFIVDNSDLTSILSISVNYNDGEAFFDLSDFNSLAGMDFSPLVGLRGTIGPNQYFTGLEFNDFSLTLDGATSGAFPNDSSPITYQNLGPAPIPLPAAVWFMLSALGGVGLMRRRVRRNGARSG